MTSATSHAVYLPNPFYAALTSVNASLALVHGLARRFPKDVVPFAAVPEPSVEALRDLVVLLTPGEEIHITAEAGQSIPWTNSLEVVSTLPSLQMRFTAATPREEDHQKVVTLGNEDMEQMLNLKARAFPGFFGSRAAELGTFFGIRDPENGCLIAMGGERLATDTEREVSAVCTDPDFVGRGYAAQIIRALLQHHACLGTSSLLHVTATNWRAISLYEHLGFRLSGSIDFVKLRSI